MLWFSSQNHLVIEKHFILYPLKVLNLFANSSNCCGILIVIKKPLSWELGLPVDRFLYAMDAEKILNIPLSRQK
jgi:hypothetical protein